MSGKFCEESFPIPLEILHCLTKEELLTFFLTGKLKITIALVEMRTEPAPVFSSVAADSGTTGSHPAAFDKMEPIDPLFRELPLEAPVKPVSRSVPTFHVKFDIMAVYGDDLDIAGWNFLCDHRFSSFPD